METGRTTGDAASAAAGDYLARLDRAAVAAGMRDRPRRELLGRTAEWIADARVRAAADPEADAMTAVLDAITDLGAPSALVAEAREHGVGDVTRGILRLTRAERLAIVGLAIGWMTVGIGLMVTVLTIGQCVRWTRREKVGAFLLAILLPAVAIQVGTASTEVTLLTGIPSVLLLLATTLGLPLGLRGLVRRRHGMPV